MREDDITEKIIACALRVHSALGPGLVESAYQNCLEPEFRKNDLKFEAQKVVNLMYEGVPTRKGYRVDFLVEDAVVVEVKAQKTITLLDHAQLKTYLKLLGLRVGLILNFNTVWLKTGIYRVINSSSP
jgi:GxxExxY protein